MWFCDVNTAALTTLSVPHCTYRAETAADSRTKARNWSVFPTLHIWCSLIEVYSIAKIFLIAGLSANCQLNRWTVSLRATQAILSLVAYNASQTYGFLGGTYENDKSSFQNTSFSATAFSPTNLSRAGLSRSLARLVEAVTPIAPTQSYIPDQY